MPKHVVWVIETQDGDPVAAECDQVDLPSVGDGEQVARYVPERQVIELRAQLERIRSTENAMERVALTLVDYGVDHYVKEAAQYAEQLAMVGAALAGTAERCDVDDPKWSPALAMANGLRVELAQTHAQLSSVRALTWAINVIGKWRNRSEGREVRLTLRSVCELHDETAIGAMVRIPGGTDLAAMVKAATWLVEKFPDLADGVATPTDDDDMEERVARIQTVSALRRAYLLTGSARADPETMQLGAVWLGVAFAQLPCPECRGVDWQHKFDCGTAHAERLILDQGFRPPPDPTRLTRALITGLTVELIEISKLVPANARITESLERSLQLLDDAATKLPQGAHA